MRLELQARQTKIICAVDARMSSTREIFDIPADALRLSYHQLEKPLVKTLLEEISKRDKSSEKRPAILLDLSEGARVQVCDLKEPKELSYGSRISFSATPGKADITLKARYWDGLFQPGVFVFVGYGNVVLKVENVQKDQIICEVSQGGTIYPDVELHIPETRLSPTLKNLTDFPDGHFLKTVADYIVLPGVVEVEELRAFRKNLYEKYQVKPWIILRVDSKSVYDHLPFLIEEIDGLFISRRELSLTLHPARVAVLVKEMIQLAGDNAKLVFTASEMLGSMKRNPTPTRAEVSDIANAVSDGTDAVVLAEEVAHGQHAERALEVMHRIIADTEQQTDKHLNWIKLSPKIEDAMDAVAHGAYTTAERVKAQAIVCVTVAGNTALKLASFRTPIPIIAVTFSQDVLRRLNLVRGVQSILLEIEPKIDEVLQVVNDRLVRNSWLKPGDKIVFVSITLSSIGRTESNIFTVQQIQ